ncbi:hypothetical protein HDV01_001629 [Terramyces sp. JEL0728]|nr:hypothetical protein HDV01_001629 [Terramyces sp. JEL0728]
MKRILCLHGMAGCKERMQKTLEPLEEILKNKYELVFIDGPLEFPKEWLPEAMLKSGSPSFNRWFENCDHLTNGETRVVYEGFPAVTVDLDLLPALEKVREHWDDSFVGILGFSNGSMVAGMVSSLLSPRPKFVLLNGTIPEGMEVFSKTLNCPSLNLMGYTDDNRHEVKRGEGLFETVHYIGGHRTIYDQATFERVAYWLELLDCHESPVEPIKYTLTIFNPNQEYTGFSGAVSIALKTKDELASLTLDSNEHIKISSCLATVLRTPDGLDSVKNWQVDSKTFRYSQKATVAGSTLNFESPLPSDSNLVLHLEFKTDLADIQGGMQFPCFKYVKTPIELITFSPVGHSADFIEPAHTKETKSIDGKDYCVQRFTVGTPIAPGLVNIHVQKDE